MDDRDHFAAAALTGLLRPDDVHSEFGSTNYKLRACRMAYDWADAMLRERERTTPKPQPRTAVLSTGDVVVYAPTNHDAAPAARASAESVAPQPTASDRSVNPTSHSGTGKQPAPPCVETDGFPPCSDNGVMRAVSERESPRRECGESSLRDVSHPDTKGRAAGGPEPLFTSGGVDRPVSYAKSDENRVDYDTDRAPRNGALSGCETVPDPDSRVWETPRTPQPHATPPQGSVKGEGSFRDSRNAKEPVAWAVETGGELEASFCGPAGREDAADWREQSDGVIVPLYRSPTITDEEREEVGRARDGLLSGIDGYENEFANEKRRRAGVLDGILKRFV